MKEISNSSLIKKVVFTGKNAYKMFNYAQNESLEELSIIKDFNLAIKYSFMLAKENWNVLSRRFRYRESWRLRGKYYGIRVKTSRGWVAIITRG